jgi:hypothetical protein
MPGYELRNYLYFDRQMVDDSLAAIEGALYDETIVHTQEKGQNLSGDFHAELPIVGGAWLGAERNSSAKTEITKQAQLTDAAKFQRVYDRLEKEDAFQYYDVIASDNWENFNRSDLLELDVSISPTRFGALAEFAESAKGLADLAEALTGQSPLDEKTREIIDGIKLLGRMESEKGIPVLMKPLNNGEYKFVAYLNPEYLRVARNRLVGEVTVFCKVQRKLKERERLDLFDPLSSVEQLQKITKSRQKQTKTKMPHEFRDTIKAPAAVIIPLAIYR